MSSVNILVIDDKRDSRDSLCEMLHREGYEVTAAEDSNIALDKLRENFFNIVLTDVKMPEMDGFELLRQIRNKWIDTKVILVTEYGSIAKATEAIKLGAFNYIEKSANFNDKLQQAIRDALRDYKKPGNGFHNFVGDNYRMREIYTMIKKVADSNATVVIGGETGTGKDLVARAIHNQSPRRERPFIKVDCAGIPEELLESDLFGHVRGSFTTAVRDRKGKFELADKGTLFFDDIDCFPMKLQAKLLRVLQDREFEKVGGTSTYKVDVRIIAASNQDLQEAVYKKLFRADLFYRLNVIHIYLPPLRERLDDIEELAYHFLDVYNRKNNRDIHGFSSEAFQAMKKHDWPGNVRELENVIEGAVVLKQKGYIEPEDLRFTLQQNVV
ncbi:MAG: sigma-54-dependent transcriptional regulator, partial [Candidatus Poribacteria bacterium]